MYLDAWVACFEDSVLDVPFEHFAHGLICMLAATQADPMYADSEIKIQTPNLSYLGGK